jgi:signal transduction histidine kinase
VSRVTSERMRLNCERIDLRKVVGHAIETTAPDIDAAKHQLTASAPEGPVWVSGDPFRLEQVFVNLISNAAKYTGNGGRISIRMELERRHAVIRVRDSGIGITPQMLPHVFDLFKQVDETSPQSRSGLGVGLTIVRSLVELHGGYVDAASRGAGKGSDFTVRLPLAS